MTVTIDIPDELAQEMDALPEGAKEKFISPWVKDGLSEERRLRERYGADRLAFIDTCVEKAARLKAQGFDRRQALDDFMRVRDDLVTTLDE